MPLAPPPEKTTARRGSGMGRCSRSIAWSARLADDRRREEATSLELGLQNNSEHGEIGMRAVVLEQHGGPEVLTVRDVPEPVPPAGWVKVRVRACALNHLDLWA